MAEYSEFIILVGDGHPYGGEGMVVRDKLSLYMKKGGWIFNEGDETRYWVNCSLEDALLIISLFFVAPQVGEDDCFSPLRKKAETLFKVPLSEHGIDTNDNKYIAKKDLQSLYDENKKVLSNSNVKIVGLRLGTSPLHGGAIEPTKEEFVKTVKEYDLVNVEYCETVYGSYFGSFSDKPYEIAGKVVKTDREK